MLSQYTGYFNPNSEEYKRVILESSGSNSIRMYRNSFHIDPYTEGAIIAPPTIVDKNIKSRGSSKTIQSIENPDPSKYPEYISKRISGNVPTSVQYANELTDFDPRYYQVANSLLLSPLHITEEELKQSIASGDYSILYGNLASLDTVLEMGETEILDLEYVGDKWFIGVPNLIDIGEEYEELFESAKVKYGGSFYSPTEQTPEGLFDIDSIYFYMNEFEESVSEWVYDKMISSLHSRKSPDEFDTIKSTDDMNPNGTCYIRAWWD